MFARANIAMGRRMLNARSNVEVKATPTNKLTNVVVLDGKVYENPSASAHNN